MLPAPRLSGHIHLADVTFRYEKAGPDVLRHLDLTVEPGSRIAIVGPSGSGKSTLGKLLLGLYEPTDGDIRYDGLSLSRISWQELRRRFGVVLQESTLFSGSILTNIALRNPAMNRECVVAAARTAAIHDDFMAMPMGYDTLVAEGGSALSGGQRQRLSIARAIANEPAILLLDEATSHLDVATEQTVAAATTPGSWGTSSTTAQGTCSRRRARPLGDPPPDVANVACGGVSGPPKRR